MYLIKKEKASNILNFWDKNEGGPDRMRYLINKFRSMIQKILGIPYTSVSLVIYRSDFPDGEIVGKPAQIGRFSIIDYGGNVKIGQNVKIGYGVFILSASSIVGSNKAEILRRPIIIGDSVEIGSNAVILPGVKIGNNTTIGAGAVVIRDIPENSIAVGVPARVVKKK